MELKFYCRLHKSTSLDAVGDIHTYIHTYIHTHTHTHTCMYVYIYIYIYIYISGHRRYWRCSWYLWYGTASLADLLRYFDTSENHNQERFFVELVHYRKWNHHAAPNLRFHITQCHIQRERRRHINSFHPHQPQFCEVHLYIFHISTPRSSKTILPFTFFDQICTHFQSLSCVLLLPSSDHQNNIW